MNEARRRALLLGSRASSGGRVMTERREVAVGIADKESLQALKGVAKPNSIARTMRRIGVALVMSPDPITDIPGAIFLAASFVSRRNEPLSASSVYREARKVLSELEWLS